MLDFFNIMLSQKYQGREPIYILHRSQENMKKTVTKVFLYPLVQLFFIHPTMVYVYLSSTLDFHLEEVHTIIVILPICIVGLINSVIYYLQQKEKRNLVFNAEVLED